VPADSESPNAPKSHDFVQGLMIDRFPQLPNGLRRIPGEVVVHCNNDRHRFAQLLDRLGIVSNLRTPVDDDVVQRRRQIVNRLPIPK
jgi:hypothetical protein